MILYLDYNATAPVHPQVLDAMVHVYREDFGNAGSRTHAYGQRADRLIAEARAAIAGLLGIERSELVFTSGATESNNLAILGLAAWGREHGRLHIISTTIEHKAILEPLAHLASQGFEVEFIPVGLSGRVDAKDVLQRLRDDTLLVTMLHANNETGVIQPVLEIGDVLRQTATFFHVDAAQTFGKEVEALRNLSYDLLSISAHKVQGPQGIGGLITRRQQRRHVPLTPIMFGGGQERGLRPGTLPVALVVGFGVAAGLVEQHHRAWTTRLYELRNSILTQLQQVPHVINGDPEYLLPNCVNVGLPSIDSEALMLILRDSIALSNGAACTSAEYASSHVLQAMGISPEIVDSSVRLSWGPDQDAIDLDPLIQAVRATI